MEKQRKSDSGELYTEIDYLKHYGIKILILSRGRCGKLTTHMLLPDYIEILVPESEREMYASQYANPILTVPDEEKGLGKVRNWVLDNFTEETIIMIDDDIHHFYCVTGQYAEQVTDGDTMLQILINTAVMAHDLGVCCFGYNQTDIRKYRGCEPFKLIGWIGCIIGIIGRKYRFRDDKYKVDIDYCLQTLLNERVIWQDARYYALQNRDNNVGGNSIFRTKKGFDESVESLKTKWKGCINVRYTASQISIKIAFSRKQKMSLLNI